jgi:glycosyltransferase involved in cell wall biosynthesis
MKVSVLMPTYNHESFIAQAIESFLAQQCNFKTELLIGNDASTDNTLKISQLYSNKYPDKIKLIDHKINQGLLKNYKSLITVARGEYFAILESDDYWTDNLKLQKQIDFLDAHPSYGLSFTGWERLKNGVLTQRADKSDVLAKYADCLYERFLLRNIIKSPTACFRRSLYEKYCNIDDYIRLEFKTFDFPVWISLIRHSDLHYINTPTAVYRSLETSISNSSSLKQRLLFENNIIQIRRYIISLYGSGKLTECRIASRETFVKARYAFRLKKPFVAIAIFCNGFVTNMINSVWSALSKK